MARIANVKGTDTVVLRIVMPATMAALAIWLVAMALRTRLVLSADSLDYRGALLSRRMAMADVLGRRRAPNTRRGILLAPRPGRGQRMLISGDLKRDEAFDAWFARIPDLDASEQAASLARVLDDRTLGATPGDVSERLARVRVLARIGNIIAVLAMLALQFGPSWWEFEADVAIALCIPLAALLAAALFRGLVTLTPLSNAANDARPSLLPMIMFPSIALLARLSTQANLRDWHPLVLPAIVCGALGTLLAMALDAGLRKRVAAALGVLACMGTFAGAAIVWLDVRMDPHVAQPVPVAVTGHSAGKGPIWAIQLGPAPTAIDWKGIVVSRRDFLDLHTGQVACLSEHPGLFDVPWAELHRCAGDAQPTPAEAAHHWLATIARPASQRPPLARTLVDGDWQTVDATLNRLQKQYEAGEANEIDVEQAFIPLYNVEPALDAPLAAWLAHAPNSYAAHLAMALHTERQIEWLSEFNERNSPSFNWQERTQFALEHVQASIALSTRPALSLMSQYRLTLQRWKQFPGWLERMIAIDPDDVLMRREYLIQHPLCPCHGQVPDDPAMRELLQANPSQRVRNTLAAYRLFERGTDAGSTQQAVDLFTQGLALNPIPQDAYTMHINAAVALIHWNRLDEAAAQLQTAIATLPGNRHAHEELGYVYELQKKMPQALTEFLVDAERGQSWAQMRAGSFMLTPEAGVPLDRKSGAYWMRRAANNGEARARDILRRHPDLMAEYPPVTQP